MLMEVAEIKSRPPGPLLTTLSRGLSILEFVARSDRLIRLRDVAEEFDMDRSSALRFLRTLEAEGYLVRHEAMKVYALGPKLHTFPRPAADAERMIDVARPVLEALGSTTGQITHLATLNGHHAVLAEVVASDAVVSVKQAVGDLEPLYSSAVGKAIYAFLPREQRTALLRRIEFTPFTPRTLRDAVALEQEADTIRAAGIAFDRQEGNEHVSCIACPVFGADGGILASIGISFVSAHLSQPIDQLFDQIQAIRDAAAAVEEALRS